jgi:hypothetical protein
MLYQDLRLIEAPVGSQVRKHCDFILFTLTASSQGVISMSQRPLPTQHPKTQEKNIHALSGIRTHELLSQSASDPRLDGAATGIGPLQCDRLEFKGHHLRLSVEMDTRNEKQCMLVSAK